jgi:alginate O-acetyltransferase complex protein AlgF
MKIYKLLPSILTTITIIASHSSQAADIPLYPTGPSQDSTFVRFINATNSNLSVSAGGSRSKIKLDTTQPASQYYPVTSKSKVLGEFANEFESSSISVNSKSGEFTSIAALNNGKHLKQLIIKETPSDFNSLKSSIALYNLNEKNCQSAGLNIVGKDIALFSQIKFGSFERRSINPVAISVQLTCDGKATGKNLDLGTLQAGQRYSIFVFAGDIDPRVIAATDSIFR